jgi:hypothetical protein
MAGKYIVDASLVSASGGGWIAGEEWSLALRVNNTSILIGVSFSQATHSTYMRSQLSGVIDLLAGDRVEIVIYQLSGGPLATLVSTHTNYVSITRVG